MEPLRDSKVGELGCVSTCFTLWIGAARVFGRVWAHVLMALGCVQTCCRVLRKASEMFEEFGRMSSWLWGVFRRVVGCG